MIKIITHPTSDPVATKNFTNTVMNSVDFSALKESIDPKIFENLMIHHPTGKAAFWGAVSGKNDVNLTKWNRVQNGDVILFYAHKKIYMSAKVAYKFESDSFANALWGSKLGNINWKLMYSLQDIQELSIPLDEYNKVLGFKKSNIIQGFNVLNEVQSNSLVTLLELGSKSNENLVSEMEYLEVIVHLDGELDRQVNGWRRVEQSFARRHLLRDSSRGKCKLCQRSMDAEFLVAAHIKRRSECSEEEKRDIGNVLMLACKFGCDYLFEVGYIGVLDGRIKISSNSPQVVFDYCYEFNNRLVEMSQKQWQYFNWHWENRFQK